MHVTIPWPPAEDWNQKYSENLMVMINKLKGLTYKPSISEMTLFIRVKLTRSFLRATRG